MSYQARGWDSLSTEDLFIAYRKVKADCSKHIYMNANIGIYSHKL